jgi:probable phosphoglycerate mutase
VAELLLLRHGSIEGHETWRFRGQRDDRLDANGRAQAARWAERLQGHPIAEIWSSDLSRTRDMAATIAAGRLSVRAETGLREISLGSWEGREIAEVRREASAAYAERGRNIATYRTPGGESFADVQARAVPILDGLLARLESLDGDILVVGHGGMNRTWLCHLLGMDLAHLFRLGQDYACLNRITADGAVRALNLPVFDFPG